jgi:hypothetical protein
MKDDQNFQSNFHAANQAAWPLFHQGEQLFFHPAFL